jgi:predicted nucleic acid-binding protein
VSFAVAPAPVVVDASVATALLAEPDDPAETAWTTWTAEGRMRLAPGHALLEIGNALVIGRRMDPAEAAFRILSLLGSGLELADRLPGALGDVLDLAARRRLTTYDAAYLWLAIDVDGELATRDDALRRAAEAEGVPLAEI